MFVYATLLMILLLFNLVAQIGKGESPAFAFAIFVFFVLYLMGYGS